MKKSIYIILLLLILPIFTYAGFWDFNWLGNNSSVGGSLGTIEQLNQFTSTTSPFDAITTNVNGKDLYIPFSDATTSSFAITGLDCTGNANGGTLTTDANGNVTCSDDNSDSATSTLDYWFNNSGGITGNSNITTLGTIGTGVWNGTAIDISSYTNLTAGTNITLLGDTLNVDDAFLVNNANDTTTGQLTATNFVASGATATSTFAGGLAVETSGLVYDYSTNRVGIGTAVPGFALDVRNGGVIRIIGDNPAIILYDTVNNGTRPSIQFQNNSLFYFSGDDTGNGGKVEFGYFSKFSDTRTNDATFKIYGDSSANWGNYLEFTHTGTGGYGEISTDTGNLILSPAGGSVGIGTTSPATRLDIYSTATTTITIDSNSTTQGGCLKMRDIDGAGYSYGTALNGVITWSTISCE